MDWIEAAYDGEARYNHFSCKSEYGRNPLVGSFFKDTFSIMLQTFEEIKCNISLLDGIIVASPDALSQQAKIRLFENFAKYKSKDPAAIVAELQNMDCS